ncbi:MAG: hypothetical protein R3251_01280, partial [Candidatus Spechtbacterales bacterium]|nr:hypothetical protein [Candidatus Spechtbacterales bacterium]
PLMRAMFIETNPIPIKTAFHLSYSNNGKVNVPEKPVFRSPMSQMSSSNLVKLKKVLNEYEEC